MDATRLRLPAPKRLPLPAEPEALLAQVQRMIDEGSLKQGYVRVETGGASHVLFLLNGTCYSAGIIEGDRFGSTSLPHFFRVLELRGRAELCVTDLPLFLCTAVLFRKAPAAQLPSGLVDSAGLIEHLRQVGKDAVLVIRLGSGRSLAFCREGEPVALYSAPGETFPEGDSVADRIVEYMYRDGVHSQAILDLYDEIQVPPATHGGQRLERYRTLAREVSSEPEPALVVLLGERVVFRFPVVADVITVGRGAPNDLALDNLSVSRQHARVRRSGTSLVMEDLGSENGLVVAGERQARVTLRPGDGVQVGTYTLVHQLQAPWQPTAPVRRAPPVPSVDETIALSRPPGTAELWHQQQRHLITGQIFTLGKKPQVHLQLKGMLIAPLHAQLERDREGSYHIRHVGGLAAVKVNGQSVKLHRLRDGDEITIGGETLRFRRVD